MKAFGTGEWAKHNFNIVSGCAHDCRYCYAKSMAVRFGRKTAETWKDETVDIEKVSRPFTRKRGRIMFPTSHGHHSGERRSLHGRPGKHADRRK